MRHFVIRALAFAALQAVVLWWVWSACPRDDEHYAAASTDKRRRLATASSPRIVFVGGSSASFGFDSRVFASSGYTPVNLGHNRGLGLSFMLEQAAAGLREGDVVIVSPEYELLWTAGVDDTLITHIEHDPPSLAYVDWQTGRRLCDAGLPWLARKLRCALHQLPTDPQLLFSRHSFDASGDFAAHRGHPPRMHDPLWPPWPDPAALDVEAALDQLDAFARRCRNVGARCGFAFAPLRRARYEAGRESIAVLEARLEARASLPVVLNPADGVHPGDAFFDAGPHLVESAARHRTERLRKALEQTSMLSATAGPPAPR